MRGMASPAPILLLHRCQPGQCVLGEGSVAHPQNGKAVQELPHQLKAGDKGRKVKNPLMF